MLNYPHIDPEYKKNPWIQTYTGKQYFYLNPTPDSIDILDIARSLSMIPRFLGHLNRNYSVGQHSLYVSRMISAEAAFWGLLHDATEAYLSDLPGPAKWLLADYVKLEKAAEAVIISKFKIHVNDKIRIEAKEADIQMVVTENAQLRSHKIPWGYHESTKPSKNTLATYTWEEVEQHFLERYYHLESVNQYKLEL